MSTENYVFVRKRQTHPYPSSSAVAERQCAMLCFTEYFAKSLKV